MDLPDVLAGPRAVLRQAIEAVPAVKWALGVAGVVAAFALAANFIVGVPPGTLAATLYSAVGMLFLMVVLTIFARLSAAAPAVFKVPIQVLTWGSILLLFVASFLFISAAFFRWPQRLCEVWNTCASESRTVPPDPIGQQPADPVETTYVGQQLAFESLPTDMRSPLAPNMSDTELRAELSRRRSLTLDGTIIRVGGIDDTPSSYVLALHTLRLVNGARVYTNGNVLAITVVRLVVDRGAIRSFPDEALAISTPAGEGRGGGLVRLVAFEPPSGRITIDLRGQSGGNGQAGAQGPPGGGGPPGNNASSSAFDCSRGAGNGGPGGEGGRGLRGSPGGSGGAGGTAILGGALADATDSITFVAGGGRGGTGGRGGLGGPGGPGGPGGGAAPPWCQGGGQAGPQGPLGHVGDPGENGPAGSDGNLSLQKQLRIAALNQSSVR